MADKFHIDHLAVIGIGLIGGSLIRALKRAGCVGEVTGVGRSAGSLELAQTLGVIDRVCTDVPQAVGDADMVVLAAPLAVTADLLGGMRGALSERTLVTDVGSVKGSIVKAARERLSAEQFRRFVPGHPVAGTEKSGVKASFAELFDHHRVILTPVSETDPQAVKQVEWMWRQCGADVVYMPMRQHDAILAATSHLPHMLAYALVDCLAGMTEHEDIFRFAAGGFADFTRIASSNPQMWHDICFANRDELLLALERFQQQLRLLTEAVRAADRATVLEMFTRAKLARDRYNDLRSAGKTVAGATATPDEGET